MSFLSYVSQTEKTAWHTYLSQVDRVLPYLGPLARCRGQQYAHRRVRHSSGRVSYVPQPARLPTRQ